jgi:hypothetical protein
VPPPHHKLGRTEKHGGASRDRTDDLIIIIIIANDALSQLSYAARRDNTVPIMGHGGRY